MHCPWHAPGRIGDPRAAGRGRVRHGVPGVRSFVAPGRRHREFMPWHWPLAQTMAPCARSPADQAAFMAGLKSFVGEARLLAQFDPRSSRCFGSGGQQHCAYMVMPFVHRHDFQAGTRAMRTPPPEAWLRKMLWCAGRVAGCCTAGAGDPAPRCIARQPFLQDIGPPVLLDLGAARAPSPIGTTSTRRSWKVNYAPIEQYADGDTELTPGPERSWPSGRGGARLPVQRYALPSTLRSIRDRMVPFARGQDGAPPVWQAYSLVFVAAISPSRWRSIPRTARQSIDAFSRSWR